MQIGDEITFGKYKWRVLDVQNNAVLIVTEHIIETRPYHNKYVDVTWADCALRKYLNSEFYDAFSEADKARIIPTINKNLDNQWYCTNGGIDTQDKIFLLSIEEVACKYFGDSSEKLYNKGAKQKYWFERKDENNSKRIAMYNGRKRWYWLRSPGRVNVKAVYIHGNGDIGIQGNNILKGNVSEPDYFGGVRPVLWLGVLSTT